MLTPLRFLITCFSLLLLTGLMAQRKHDLYFGCHMTDTPVSPPSLTDEERMLTCGSNERSDSIDILNYAVELDLRAFGNSIAGACTLTFTAKEDGLDFLPLDLMKLTVDSVTMMGNHLTFDYDQLLLNIHLPNAVNIGDTTDVTVFYHGLPTPDGSWGGFRYANGIGYNLGIGLTSNPYPIGRSWHPCFDNFVERATYDISIISNGGRKGYAVGEFVGEDTLSDGSLKRSYRLGLPNPTYLTGTATSNYIEVHDMHSGVYGDYPILLVGRQGDGPGMVSAFEYLGDAVDALESWYGPYQWGQVGYIMTPQGAMEHSSLIAFPYGSIGGGPTFGMNRLMAHELAHHWWGNITTLSCPENMWIKEGNAEYGSHLFQEYTFGKDFFLEVVKNNHYDVVQNAHLDDGGNYLPLSGIPYEYTYGTHTYNKGACIMHNLRGYLGDSLFSVGMTSVLETYRFSAVDAQQMQDQLTSKTGIDMSHFFNNWIYQPGFASYEIDSVTYAPNGNTWDATLHIQQKLHHALSFHTNTPMEVTFFDKTFNQHIAQIMVSGEFTDVTVSGVPFEPALQVLNDRNELNLGRFQDRVVVDTTGKPSLSRVSLSSTDVIEFPAGDSAMLNVIHQYVAPDPEPTLPELTLSSTHYWEVGGILPSSGFTMKADLFYKGGNGFDLDFDLIGDTELLILVWRPNAATPWGEYPYYIKQALGSTQGRMRVAEMLPGQYAFANGEAPLATAAADFKRELAVKVYPNPAANGLNVQAILPTTEDVQLTIFDGFGKMVTTSNASTLGGQLSTTIDVSNLPAGMYLLDIQGTDGAFRTIEKFVKK